MVNINLEVGDVVQLAPWCTNEEFAGCFMVITEVKSWGAQGYVLMPAMGRAYYRAQHEEMERVGKAVWEVK